MREKNSKYQPPYTITPTTLRLVAEIGVAIGRLSAQADTIKALRLRRINRIRSIQGSLAIEGNTLSEKQVTAILDGQRVIARPREIQEVRNAIAAYDRFEQWQPMWKRNCWRRIAFSWRACWMRPVPTGAAVWVCWLEDGSSSRRPVASPP